MKPPDRGYRRYATFRIRNELLVHWPSSNQVIAASEVAANLCANWHPRTGEPAQVALAAASQTDYAGARAFMIGRPPKHDWTSARALALNGVPLTEISARLNIPHGTLTNRAFREKWLIRQTFGSTQNSIANKSLELAKANLMHSNQRTRQTAADLIAQNGSASRLHLSGAIKKVSAHLESLPENELLEKSSALDAVSRSAARVHAWNQGETHQHSQTINLQLLSTTPQELWLASKLTNAGRLSPSYSHDDLQLAIASLSESERARFLTDFPPKSP